MKGWILFVMAVLCVLPAQAADVPDNPEVEIIDEIIAKVNGKIITRTDMARARRTLEAELVRRKMPETEISEQVTVRERFFLRDRIDHLLLLQRGDQLSINVDGEVSNYFANLMLQFKIADQDVFAQMVREQTGERFEDYKEEVANGMLTQRVISQEVGSRVKIPREDVVAYYEEHKEEFMREERVFLREILISTADKEGDELAEAEKKANDIVERARRGERFEELATENSDAGTAEAGGDLGGWKKGDLLKSLEDMVWDKEKNFVTDPIKQESGYLILKVIAHHQAGIAHLEEVENDIMNQLYGPVFEPKVREYLTELRDQAYLEIKEGYIDTAAAPGKDTTWKDPAKLTPETITKEEVIAKPGRKKLLWLIPIPGTKSSPTSSSR